MLANRLQIAVLWGQPCQAYNVCVRPGAAAAAMLAAVQAGARRLEPSLLRVPESALHANVAWLLPVHQEYDQAKDELWRRRGPGWLAALASAAGQASGFCLRFRRLVATDSAVIAVADEPNRLAGLRRELLDLPGVTVGRGLAATLLPGMS